MSGWIWSCGEGRLLAGALADRARLSRSRPDVVPSVVEKCLGSARVRRLPVVRKTGQPADRRAFRLVRASRRPSCVYCTSRWKATKARALWYIPVRASFPHQLTRSLAGGPTTRAGPQTTQGRRRHGPGPRRARQVCFTSSHRPHDLTDAPPPDPTAHAPSSPRRSYKRCPRSSRTPTPPSGPRALRSHSRCTATSGQRSTRA